MLVGAISPRQVARIETTRPRPRDELRLDCCFALCLDRSSKRSFAKNPALKSRPASARVVGTGGWVWLRLLLLERTPADSDDTGLEVVVLSRLLRFAEVCEIFFERV